MENKKKEKFARINLKNCLYDKVLKSISYRNEISVLNEYLNHLDKDSEINDLKLYEDIFNCPFDSEIKRYVVEFEINDKKIRCTGVDFISENAILKALSEATERYLFSKRYPFDYVYDFKTNQFTSENQVFANTNGFAFHNNLHDTFLNSFYELIERHLVLLHWYTKRSALAIIDVDRIGYLKRAKEFFICNNVNFNVLLLDKIGDIKVTCILVTTKNEKLSFYNILSFSAHHDIFHALKKAYFELMMKYMSSLKSKVKKDYSLSTSVENIDDHILYFQYPERTTYFDFLVNNKINHIRPEVLSINKIIALFRNIRLAKELDLKTFIGNPIIKGQKFYFIKTTTHKLLVLKFGQSHCEVNLELLREYSNTIDLEMPHPIS